MSTPLSIVTVSGSLQTPSKTDALLAAVVAAIGRHDSETQHSVIEIAQIGALLAGTVSRDQAAPELEAALDAVGRADLLIVGSPVYKGSYTGLFKHFFDLLDQKALTDIPVLLTATGGSDRHALVIDHQLRPLFGFFGALALPLGIYAIPEHFDGYTIASEKLLDRVELAARQALFAVGTRQPATVSASV